MRRIAAAVSLIALAPVGVVALLSGPAAAETTCDGKVPTIVVTPGVATVGTPGDDVILGGIAPDRIDGGAGNDTICGFGGGDITRACRDKQAGRRQQASNEIPHFSLQMVSRRKTPYIHATCATPFRLDRWHHPLPFPPLPSADAASPRPSG